MKMKSIDDYMKINYSIEITKIPEEEGGGYSASIPMLGKFAFIADGDTINQAIGNLNKIKKEIFAEYIAKGIIIPEPSTKELEKEEYSGKLQLRIPKTLHKRLSDEASKEGISLNQYLNYLLTANFERNIKMHANTKKSMYYYDDKDYKDESNLSMTKTLKLSAG